jgi:hypothetical protein
MPIEIDVSVSSAKKLLSGYISSFEVLSPKLPWWTPNLSSKANIRFDIGVCAGNVKWRPPFNCPEAPPATTMGNGS